MLHNHPGQSGFSLNDLGLYIKQNSVQTITIVTNKSQVKYITKQINILVALPLIY